MKSFLAIRQTGHSLTHVYTETFAEADRQVTNWLNSHEADHTHSVAIIYTPNDQLLRFKRPRPLVSRWLSSVRWLNRNLTLSDRWLTPTAQPAAH